MPVSKTRKKKTSRRVAAGSAPVVTSADLRPNPAWFLPVMIGLWLLGLIWVVVFYVTAGTTGLPVPGLGNWNLLIGFGLIILGFIMATRWR